MKTIHLLLLLLASAGYLQLANAGAKAPEPPAGFEWPHARGPQFDGRFPRRDPLPPWPATGPTLRWAQPLKQGFSGLVVARGRVFTQHQTSSGQELVCLDLASGAVLWRSRYAYPWEMDGKYPGPYGTPTVVGDKVFFSDCYGVIGCARTTDGAILWRFDAVKNLTPEGVDFGYAATPLVVAGRLYAPAPAGGGGASVFCLEAETGALLWRSGNSHASYASCTPLTLGGTDYLLLPLRNGIALFNRRSGAEVWKDEWTRGYDEHSIWPIFHEPYLYCGSPFRRGSRVYRVTVRDAEISVDLVWADRVLSADVLASALHDGHLYGFDVQSQQSELRGRTRGTLKCVELATGNIKWTATGLKHCSVTQVGDRLLLLEDEGDLVLVEPSTEAYRELARARLPQQGKIWAAPVLIGDQLLVRGPESVACYFLGTEAAKPDHAVVQEQNAPAAAKESGSTVALRGWFERYRTDAFIAPSLGVLAEWYFHSLWLLAVGLWLHRPRPGGGPRGDWTTTTAILGIAGTGVLTLLLGHFVFTAPLALHALFCRVVPACRDPRNTSSAGRGRAYLALAGFIAVCYAYYQACAWLFLVAGWGFLAGFPMAVALAWGWQRSGFTRANIHRAFAWVWSLTTFTAYYWASALTILWSAK